MEKELFTGSIVNFNESLKNYSSFKIGGNADIIIRPESVDALLLAISVLKKNSIKYMIIGNGTNILFGDEGYRGAVIVLKNGICDVNVCGNKINAMAGASLKKISKAALANSLKGLEFAHGIPGSLGGGIVMNAGAYGGELKDVIKRVRVMDFLGNLFWIDNEDMDFSYRNSRILRDNLVVVEAEFELESGNYDEILFAMKDYDNRRSSKQPLNFPSAGSTFKRPKEGYASKLIEDANLKGLRHRGAMVSEKHSGFIINYDNASCEDVLGLISIVQNIVSEKFGIFLEPEVKIVK